MEAPLVCVDVGSTFTKAAAIGVSGQVLALAQRPTTSDTDVLVGLDAAVADLGLGGVPDDRILACSSAGGGLRLAVVGHERVISAEAGRRVALSAGARVVAVTAGRLDGSGIARLADARPDLLLLVGGTDGGDQEVLLHNAATLGASTLAMPVVVAGNTEAADAAADALGGGSVRLVRATGNVIPRIGTLAPEAARTAIRELFIAHVIGGKGLSEGPRFGRLVIGATPDVVLAGIEVVAEVLAESPGAVGDVLTIDVGGATTDIYSVLDPGGQESGQVVEQAWHGRTVEGDLGMRWSAPDVLVAARAERLLGTGGGATPGPAEHEVTEERLVVGAARRHAEVGLLPADAVEQAIDAELARLAAVIAVRRHARPGPDGVRDLRHVGLVIGSGGVLRHSSVAAESALRSVVGDLGGGWRVPEHARLMVDQEYLLAPVGLLALTGRREAARSVATRLVGARSAAGGR